MTTSASNLRLREARLVFVFFHGHSSVTWMGSSSTFAALQLPLLSGFLASSLLLYLLIIQGDEKTVHGAGRAGPGSREPCRTAKAPRAAQQPFTLGGSDLKATTLVFLAVHKYAVADTIMAANHISLH